MSDKRPLALDHGASLFHGAKADPRHRAAGRPHGARGASREHVDQQAAPPLPWAVSERAAPHKTESDGFSGPLGVPGAVPAEGAAVMPRGAPHGRSLYAAESAPPRRRVAGKHAPLHEEQRPAELRRAKLKGPHALSNKLKSELSKRGR